MTRIYIYIIKKIQGLEILALALVALTLAGCDNRRHLISDFNVWVRVSIDWTAEGITPNGTSVYFFPENDGNPSVLRTHGSIDSIRLNYGSYKVMAMNETEMDHNYMKFRGTKILETFEAVANEANVDEKFRSRSKAETFMETPEDLAVEVFDKFEITADMIVGGVRPLLEVSPRNVLTKVELVAHVKHLDYAMATTMSGIVSGMAGGMYVGTGEPSAGAISHVFKLNNRTFYDGSTTDGTLSATFYCFGLASEVPGYDGTPNIVTLFLTLRNGSAHSPVEVDVTSTMEVTGSGGQRVIRVEVGADGSIELPYVQPAGSGAFDATVNDWDDEVIMDIPLTK